MKKDFDFEKFEDEMTELGDTLGLSVSLVKTTGIVTAVYSDGTFDTIEGNSSNQVREKTGYKISEATGFIHVSS